MAQLNLSDEMIATLLICVTSELDTLKRRLRQAEAIARKPSRSSAQTQRRAASIDLVSARLADTQEAFDMLTGVR